MVFTLLNKRRMIERHTSILVVDDNVAALETLRRLLVAWGVTDVCCASSAEEALDIILSRPFDLILCDYRLDGMDGVEFLERVRKTGDLTPVMMMSGAPDKAGVIRAMEQTEVDFLAKPFRIDELAAAIERLAPRESGSRGAPAREAWVNSTP
jgi:DNA-binding response OmpR family regulator